MHLDNTATTRFITMPQLTNLLGISKATIYRHCNNRSTGFPPYYKIGARTVWDLAEVEAYIQRIKQVPNAANDDVY